MNSFIKLYYVTFKLGRVDIPMETMLFLFVSIVKWKYCSTGVTFVITMFHRKENTWNLSNSGTGIFFLLLLVNKLLTPCFKRLRIHEGRNRFLLWRGLDFLVLGSLICKQVYQIVHVQLLYEMKHGISSVLCR